MELKERISRIREYFKEMQIVNSDGQQIIYVVVIFPKGWIIDEDISNRYNIAVQRGNSKGEFYFCTEIENGENVVFDAIDYSIERMKNAIERANLLTEKTKELKEIFENEEISIESLRELSFLYDEPSLSNKKKEKEEEKINE